MLSLVLLVAIASVQAGVPHGGLSVNSRSEDGHGNYAFKYDILDPLGAKNGRHEEGDAYGNKRGFYHITDVDGRSRRVDYVADEHGFRAVVQTNEPGTATSEPAGAIIKSSQDGHVHDVPSPVVVAPPPQPIHTVYSSDLLPQPQVVRLALPIRTARPPWSHSTPLFPVTTRTRIVPASPAVVEPYFSHHSRIVPASSLGIPVEPLSHTTILNGHNGIGTNNGASFVSHGIGTNNGASFVSHGIGTNNGASYLPHGIGTNDGASFVSYRIVPRSHHSYLPVRSHLV